MDIFFLSFIYVSLYYVIDSTKMPSCIDCKPKQVTFPTGKGLLIHLQKCHKYRVINTYKCGEEGCQRKFTCSRAFVKHVNRCAKDNDNDVGEQPISLVPDMHCDEDFDLISDNILELDEQQSTSVESFKSSIVQQADAFVCKYYSKASLPRNVIQDIIDDTQEFLSDGCAMNTLKQQVMKALHSSQAEPSTIENISSLFECIQDPFSHLKTEHLRFKHFVTSGNYIAPINIELGKRLLPIKTKGGVKYKWRPVYAVQCPIAPVLKKFLELKDSLSSILKYMDSLMKDKETISNFIQGELWKQKRLKFHPTDIVLPLYMYFDDFESNNNLGPHCVKIGGVYVSIACLPPEISSRLENIFLGILFYSQDREVFKAKKILKPLLDELEILEKDGIEVMLPTGNTIRVYFVMCLLLGDNLGVHQLCGFVCSFAWANYPCRFCKIPLERMQYDVKLDRSLLRNKQNYEQDLLTGDQTRTGITESCALNSLESFHITDNLEGDLLHDLDEGISHKIMTFVLTNLTKSEDNRQKPLLTLTTLNRRIQYFNFGTHSALYQTKLCINAEELQKGKLKMTGSEMECFVRNFGVLIGDIIPESNVHWKLYLCLQRVLNILLSKTLSKSSIKSLKFHLMELGRQYLSFDGNHLTFKFHKILWHYCDIIEQSGPVAHLTTRRYESKHRQIKLGLYSNMSRVHACWSAAVKHQLGLCHRFVAGESVLPPIEMGSGNVFGQNEMKVFSFCLDSLQYIFQDLTSVFIPNWIDFKGSRYDKESTLVIDIDDNFGWPIFGELKSIFVSGETVAVLCRKLETLGFYEHYFAYEVKRTKDQVCLDIQNLIDPLPVNTLLAPKGGCFVVMRYQL